jgi:nitrous oxidase accessory protein
MIKRNFIFLHFLLGTYTLWSNTITVGKFQLVKTIKSAIESCEAGDTVKVASGFYQEGNIVINKPIILLGEKMPVLDGNRKYEVLTIKANHVTVKGFKVQHSGYGSLEDPGGIKVYQAHHVTITENYLYDNFFGIYLQYCNNVIVRNNRIEAFGKDEHQIGNGIHCWKSDSLQISGNKISGNRDGIYFEFVTHSVIWRNVSFNNIRYGLHFMFSNNDAYFTNCFRNNGAGVAVMFTKNVVMMNNMFKDNWGDAAYGLLLKEISDCYMGGNKFLSNTAAIFMDGTNRMKIERNEFSENGWGMKIQANCMDNVINHNNFFANTFDVSTNGTLTLNQFYENYWDKYEGYDINKDKIGDLPYHPLSLYSVIVEGNPPAMLLYRSFMISLLDKSEKILPSLTPENFVDLKPLMHSINL